MIRPSRIPLRSDREGQTLAVVAISIVALLAMMSLGIDLGMAYTARTEAQRVADSAALAGASVFLDTPETEDRVAAAEARARDYAARNVVRNRLVDPNEDVDVWVLLDQGRVRVRVERTGLPAWFARFIGRDQLSVSAVAAAAVMDSGAAECLKPWAVIDLFHHQGARPEDETTMFEPGNPDYRYAPNNSDYPDNATGYGAEEGDFGKQMVIKAQDPNDPNVPQPGVFLPIRLPEDEGQESCSTGGGGGGGDAGAAVYRQNICSCNRNPIGIGDALPIQTGNMVGPTRQGVRDLIAEDPGLQWDDAANGGQGGVVNSSGNLVSQSPRIVNMILIGPDQIQKSGMQQVTVTNLAMFFIEGFQGTGNDARLTGRFFGPVKGTDSRSPVTSPIVKILRLVE
jgi:hypothetical protein